MGQVNANIFSSNVSIKIANYANENSYPSLGAGDAGTLVYDESLKALVYWNGQGWNKISFQGPESGDSPQTAIRDFQAWAQSNPVSGSYWVRPTGYGGSAEQVYVAVNESSQSGITSGGVWVRIRYAESYYSRSNAWRGQGGLSNPANQSSTAYSGDFSFEQSNAWISGLLTTGNFTEIRQTFESWGYGSVGWTYGSGYMESRGFDNVNYTRWGTNSNIVGKDYSRVNGMSHRSGGSLNGPFDNPTGRNTDDTDRNDSTWRYGRFHFRYVPPGGSSALPLPIKGIWNADVDGGSEQRYFPFRDAAGGWTGSGDSNIWVKVAN